MSSHSRRAVVLAAVAGLLLADAESVQAAEPVWNMAPCVTVDSMKRSATESQNYIMLDVKVAQCATIVAGGGFRLATYAAGAPTGDAPGYNVRHFDPASPGIAESFTMAAAPASAGPYGVCVLAGQNRRVGCVRLTVARTDDRLKIDVRPLHNAAQLVGKDVVTTPYTGVHFPESMAGGAGRTGNACGTCY
jgi:hypothetical protein